MTTPVYIPCKHNPAGYGADPKTGDVWCFRCNPPRKISKDAEAQPDDALALLAEALDIFSGERELCYE